MRNKIYKKQLMYYFEYQVRTLESQGKSFIKGVKFSVHAVSLGNDEYRKKLELGVCATAPVGLKLNSGERLLEGLIKFNEAHKSPDSAFVRPFHS
jgi:hypothetical protein